MHSVFTEQVWRATSLIPRGKITTYRNIARRIGRPGAYRAVGNALNSNPKAPAVPCHRVVKSDGRLGGYARGVKAKIRLLLAEGIRSEKGRIVDFNKHLI